MAKLKDIGVIITGNTPKTSDPKNYETTDIPFIKPSDISDDAISYLHKSEFYISEYAREKSRIVPVDSILFTCIGIIGKIAVNKVECAFNQQINAIIPDKSKCLTDYLVYALQSKKRLLQETANAPVVPILNKTQFSEIEIELPSLEQQEKISVQLNKINDLISQRNLQLSKLDELVKSRFIELFGDPMDNQKGWDKVNISAVVGGKVSNGFFAKRDDYCDDGNVKVLGVAHVVNRMYSNTEGLPKTHGTEADIAKYGVKYGDMLFCRSSLVAAGIGKASIVPKNVPSNVLFECHVIRLPLDLTKCVPEFMQVLSTMEYFRNQVIAQSKTATMTTIGQDGILKTDIILPPMEIQKKFLAFVEQTDKSKSAVQQSLEKLETLKKSLMQQYFE